MTPVEPHWTGYWTAIALPLVAIFGACVAFMQVRTAQKKLRLDLFERREAVYLATREIVLIGQSSARFSDQQYLDFVVKTQAARWLFGGEVHQYLKTVILKKMDAANAVNFELELYKNDPKAVIHGNDERAKLLKWFGDEIYTLDRVFAKYLALSD